jgi:hypothetical protein
MADSFLRKRPDLSSNHNKYNSGALFCLVERQQSEMVRKASVQMMVAKMEALF